MTFSLFAERDLASITADDCPGERLIVCQNPEPELPFIRSFRASLDVPCIRHTASCPFKRRPEVIAQEPAEPFATSHRPLPS
jgi:hypothetical protein